jgi:hypothetical protein
MTRELEDQRQALAAEVEHLRIQRDEMKASGQVVDEVAELAAVKIERAHIKAERERIATVTDQRIADQGRSARGDVLDLAVATALERQRIADHTAEQDAHLAMINGSIEKSAKALEALVGELAAMKQAREKETAVAEALAQALKDQAEGGLTTKRLYISVAALVVPLLATLLVVIFKG